MNLFALNAAELNGSIEVWSWYGSAALAVNGAGDVQKGLIAGGDAEIVTAGALAPRLDVYGTFDASNVAMAAYGEDMGTPLIAINGVGFFGPVISRVPRGEKALIAWDAVLTLVDIPGFYEIKRRRDEEIVFD